MKLIGKLKSPELRLWYAFQATEHGWSRSVLVHQIESELHLRARSTDNNFAATLPAPQSDLARELIKDTFNLEVLDIREFLRERELEESQMEEQSHVEYTLRDATKPIAVSDYTLQKTLPPELKGALPTVAELKKGLRKTIDSESATAV